MPENLTELKKLLAGKRMFLLVMLSNPALMEHQSFTDMLFALFHLTDELLARERLDDLPEADLEHLNRDVNRVLRAVLIHWVGYLRHIQADYPYLFSLELRRNPFREHAEINFPGPSDIH
ncbi:hypothetical protein SDC9_200434 [bioreactor metagenome]|uniref:Uncharacterized protein n=1 Tax=bioreactor metagenome TaxID=1076179 RepID=A0A645IN83_9ZZZZ